MFFENLFEIKLALKYANYERSLISNIKIPKTLHQNLPEKFTVKSENGRKFSSFYGLKLLN